MSSWFYWIIPEYVLKMFLEIQVSIQMLLRNWITILLIESLCYYQKLKEADWFSNFLKKKFFCLIIEIFIKTHLPLKNLVIYQFKLLFKFFVDKSFSGITEKSEVSSANNLGFAPKLPDKSFIFILRTVETQESNFVTHHPILLYLLCQTLSKALDISRKTL